MTAVGMVDTIPPAGRRVVDVADPTSIHGDETVSTPRVDGFAPERRSETFEGTAVRVGPERRSGRSGAHRENNTSGAEHAGKPAEQTGREGKATRSPSHLTRPPDQPEPAVGHCVFCNEPVYGRHAERLDPAHPCCVIWIGEWCYDRCYACIAARQARRRYVREPLPLPPRPHPNVERPPVGATR